MGCSYIAGYTPQHSKPVAIFSKAPETFRARKAIFSSSVSRNGEEYTPETSCIKRAFAHIKVILSKLFYFQTFFETWRNEHS